jgi:F-type H+-transporting ATPase subunit b
MIDFNYTLIIQFFNFLILLVLLNFLLFKPVLKVLEKREKTISSLTEGVQTAGDDAKSLEKMYEEGVKEKRRPILDENKTALLEANNTSMRIIEKARTELSGELSKIRADIGNESARVFDALRSEVDKLSAEAAEKILKRSL